MRLILAPVAWLTLTLLLHACSQDGLFGPQITVTPSNTATPTATATRTASPTLTATPAPLTEATPALILEPPGRNPSPTAVPPPVNLPLETLALLEPGPGSHVASPFRLEGYGGPSLNDRVQIRLLSQDGTPIVETSLLLLAYPGNAGRFLAELRFDLAPVSALAWLQAEIRDRRLGLISHITTRDLILLSVGQAQVIPSARGPEQLLIIEPIEGSFLDQGTADIHVIGRRDEDVPIYVEIWDRNGNVLAQVEVSPDTHIPARTTSMQVPVEFQVDSSQYGRVVVYERLPGDIGIRHLSSVEVYLRR